MKTLLLFCLSLFLLSGCFSSHQKEAPPETKSAPAAAKKIHETLKKEIYIGMSQLRVKEALGSPNIVARNKKGREIWVHDRIAVRASDTEKEGKAGVVLFVIKDRAGTPGSSQGEEKLLTAVITFDEKKQVESFSCQ